MTKELLTLVAISLISCTSNDNNDEILKPNWEVGDYRFFDEKGSYFAKVKNDTLANSTFEKIIKMTVVEKQDDYILEIEILPAKDFSFNLSVDSLDNQINNTLYVLKDLTKYNLPYKIRVSPLGELLEIVDFDSYYEKFIEQVFHLKDSIKINEESKQTIKILTQSDSPFKQRLEETLWKEVDEYFDIYNTTNPVDRDVTKDFNIPDSKTGEPTPITLTFHSLSVSGDIQEIELIMKFEKKLSDILANDSLQTDAPVDFDPNTLGNRTIYSYNMRTTWAESIQSSIRTNADSIEMRIIREIKISK